MAARSPRKIFASSFVVTIAACYTETATPPPQPPQQPPVTQHPHSRPDNPDVVANPPRPSPAQTYAFDQRWTISKSGDTCTAMARVDCPKPNKAGDPVPTCNPPPPMKVACPGAEAGWDGKSPLAVVQYANQAECMVEPAPVKCPPNVACNPPPPRKVACPTPSQ